MGVISLPWTRLTDLAENGSVINLKILQADEQDNFIQLDLPPLLR